MLKNIDYTQNVNPPSSPPTRKEHKLNFMSTVINKRLFFVMESLYHRCSLSFYFKRAKINHVNIVMLFFYL